MPRPSESDSAAGTLPINDRRIGSGEPVFIVAEAGVNHNGSLQRALQLVDQAVECRADAVKFQLFRARDLVTDTAPTATYQRKATSEISQQALLARLELSLSDFEIIRNRCDARGITFLVTPFTCNDVDRAVSLGVPALKIASTDLTNTDLLGKAIAADLPLLLSTGASSAGEKQIAVQFLRDRRAIQRTVLLHCVSCYPTPLDAMNLRAVQTLREAHGVPTGLSDHTTSTRTGAWAAALGACVLEKHLTLDRNDAGPDHAISLDPSSFHDYVINVRTFEKTLGDGRLEMKDIEQDVRTIAGKSLVSSRVIPAGATLLSDMMSIKRPGIGIHPNQRPALLGRRAAREIAADTVLTWDMIE